MTIQTVLVVNFLYTLSEFTFQLKYFKYFFQVYVLVFLLNMILNSLLH